MSGNEADPFEEFEFKPLTEGLGFHRKPETSKSEKSDKKADRSAESALSIDRLHMKSQIETPKSVAPAAAKLPENLLDLSHLDSEDIDKPLLKAPLLRRNKETPTAPALSSKQSNKQPNKVDDVLKTFKDRKWDFDEEKSARKSLKTPPVAIFKISGHDLSAIILDAMLVTATFLGCLIVLLMVTQADLIAAVTTTSSLVLTGGLAGTFAVVCWGYLIINRLFLGATPGEWVFDQRVGAPDDQGRALFSLKVLARATLVLATGVVIIPILSILMGRDLLGRFLGIELRQKSYI